MRYGLISHATRNRKMCSERGRYVYTQVKKNAFKIKAKIGDVGLIEDLKKYRNKKWSLNFHDKPILTAFLSASGSE